MAKRLLDLQPVLDGMMASAEAFRWLDDYGASILIFGRECPTNKSENFKTDYPLPDVTPLSLIDPELDRSIIQAQSEAALWSPDADHPKPVGGFQCLREEVIDRVYGVVARSDDEVARRLGLLTGIEDQVRSAGGNVTREQWARAQVQLLALPGDLGRVVKSIAAGANSMRIFGEMLARVYDEWATHASDFPTRVDRYGDRLWQQMIKTTGKTYGKDSIEQRVSNGYLVTLKDYWNEQMRLHVIPLNAGARMGLSGLQTAWETVRGLLESAVDRISRASLDEVGGVFLDLDIVVFADSWREVVHLAAKLRTELS